MISRTSNQPNFKGVIRYTLKSSGATHKISIPTKTDEDGKMFLNLTSYLEQQKAYIIERHRDSIQASISHDGEILSYQITPEFYKLHRHMLTIKPKETLPPATRQKEEYASRLLNHDKLQSITFFITKDELKKVKKLMTENTKLMISKEKSIKTKLQITIGYLLYKIGLPFYYKKSLMEALPKADHAKVKAFFKG